MTSAVIAFLTSRAGRYVLVGLAGVALLAGLLAWDRHRISAAELRGRTAAIAEAAARLPAEKVEVAVAVARTDSSGKGVDSAIAAVDAALEPRRRAPRRSEIPEPAPAPVSGISEGPAGITPVPPPAVALPAEPVALAPADTGLAKVCLDLRNACEKFRADVTLERAARTKLDAARDLDDLRAKDRIRALEKRPSRKAAIAGAVLAAGAGYLAGRR